MKIVVTGSEGTVGKKLKKALPDAIGIDLKGTAQICGDLATIDFTLPQMRDTLDGVDALIHLATSADPEAPDGVHWQAVANAARLFPIAAKAGVKHLIVASSDWAEPKSGVGLNAYGHSRRVLESMAAMYGSPPRRGTALRVGWVPASIDDLASAPDWLVANYWDDGRLIEEFRQALGL